MNDSVLVLSIVSAIVAGTPILFATLGEILTERSGVMNLGVGGDDADRRRGPASGRESTPATSGSRWSPAGWPG